MSDPDRTVDFGFEEVPWAEKAGRVRSVFASVAGRYDLMNDLMSFGVHRVWKRFALSLTGLKPGQRALDVAGGTGDLAAGMLRQVGAERLQFRPRRDQLRAQDHLRHAPECRCACPHPPR